MKMQSLFTHHQVVFKLYEFLSSAVHERRFIFEECWWPQLMDPI